MKKKCALSFRRTSLFLLCLTLMFVGVAPLTDAAKTVPAVRNIEISSAKMDNETALNAFDSYSVDFAEEGKANFVGYKEIPLTDLYDLDLVSEENIDETAKTKFTCTYDYDNGIVILSALLESSEETVVLDEIYGVIFMNDEGEFDVTFSIDGEIILLSEMMDAGMIENCGLFSKIGSTLKKVWNTTSGKIGTIATVVACAAVGAVCAVVPGGQLVTAVCIGIAVGAVGGAVTAACATYEADGEVDLEAVAICAGVGAVVGGAVSAASYGITSAITSAGSSSGSSASASSGSSGSSASASKGTTEVVKNTAKNVVEKGKEFFGSKGQSLGKLCDNPGMKIDWTQLTKHGAEQMAKRGMTQTLMEKIVKTGVCLQQSATKYLFFTAEGVVVLDSGKVVTTYSAEFFDAIMKELVELFFGIIGG